MRTTIPGFRFLICPLICAGLLGAPRAHSQEAGRPFSIKVDAAFVPVEVAVAGKSVPPLGPEDFIIVDNGEPQPVSWFSRDPFPLAIALMVDRSPSIGRYLPMLQLATLSALRLLQPGDRVVLFAFDTHRWRQTGLTGDRQEIADKISRLRVSDRFGTVLYDPVVDAALYLQKEAPESRHAIILFSDNLQVGSGGYSAKEARAKALEAAATVYSIQTPTEVAGYETDSDEKMRWIAEETGGRLLELREFRSVHEALASAVTELRTQYTLGFHPSSPGEEGSFHRLEVKLADEGRCPGCRLLARKGYYAGIRSPGLQTPGGEAPSPELHRETDEDLIKRSIVTVASGNLEIGDIPFEAAVSGGKDEQGVSGLKVDLAIDVSGVHFETVGQKRRCRLRVVLFHAREDGRILGSQWRVLEGELGEETHRRVLRTGIALTAFVPVTVSNPMLKIVVYDEGSDKVGSRLMRTGAGQESGPPPPVGGMSMP